ncbi:hypothetical protein B4U79_04382, partial [Dinothrombium tinctorium]
LNKQEFNKCENNNSSSSAKKPFKLQKETDVSPAANHSLEQLAQNNSARPTQVIFDKETKCSHPLTEIETSSSQSLILEPPALDCKPRQGSGRNRGTLLLFIPKHLINQVLFACHDDLTSGHFGFNRTWARVKERYFWKNMFEDVKNALETAKFFTKEIVCKHGAPKEILSDRGTAFLSSLAQNVFRLFHTYSHTTTAYNPACNGLTERLNGTLARKDIQADIEKMIQMNLIQESTSEWASPILIVLKEDPNEPTKIKRRFVTDFRELNAHTVKDPYPMPLIADI